MNKKIFFLSALILLTSCSKATPPMRYTASTPERKLKELYHETMGLVISHKERSSIAFSPQTLKPLTKNFLDSIHRPVQVQKKKPLKNLFTKKEGHDKYIKFYLPMKLESIVNNLSEQATFTLEVISMRGRHIVESSSIWIKETIQKAELLEVHLTIDDESLSLSPSEAIHIKLPIGKKEQVLIPKGAIYKDAFTPYVFIINHAGYLEKRKIKIENSHGEMISIAEGLADHPQVAIPH